MKKFTVIFILFITIFSVKATFSKEVPYTLEDRDRMIRLETKLDEIDKRFEQVITFMWILTTIFIAITSATIGFAFWDRKTALKPVEEKLMVNEKKIENALAALRKLASVDKKVYAILKEFNLL